MSNEKLGINIMDFFKNMRDMIHGFSHETRTALAMAIMGVFALSFFAIWNTVAPLRLVSLSPIPPAVKEAKDTGPAQLTMAGPFEPVPAQGAGEANASEDILSPAQGIAGTFGGLGDFFAPTDEDQTFISMARSLADFGRSVVRGAMRLYEMAADLVMGAMGALQRTSINFVVPNY